MQDKLLFIAPLIKFWTVLSFFTTLLSNAQMFITVRYATYVSVLYLLFKKSFCLVTRRVIWHGLKCSEAGRL